MSTLQDPELDQLPAICVLKDQYGAFVYTNKHIDEWFEQPPGGFLGKTDYHLMNDSDAAVVREHDKMVLLTEETLRIVENVSVNGLRTHYFCIKFLIKANDRKFLGVVGIRLHEKTRKRADAEEWIAQNFDRIKERMQTLADMLSMSKRNSDFR